MAFNFSPRIVTKDLVLYLDAGNTKSYPGSGTDWFDLSGNLHDGLLSNGPTFNSSNLGSIVFDGIDDYVRVVDTPLLNPLNNITLCAWSYYNGYSGYFAPIIFKQNTGSSYFEQYSLAYNIGGGLNIAFGNGSYNEYVVSPLTYANQIVNVVGVIDTINSILKLYANGELVASTSVFQTQMDISTNDVVLGSDNNIGFPGYLDGNIYNASIYNRVLTDDEILQNFLALRPRYL